MLILFFLLARIIHLVSITNYCSIRNSTQTKIATSMGDCEPLKSHLIEQDMAQLLYCSEFHHLICLQNLSKSLVCYNRPHQTPVQIINTRCSIILIDVYPCLAICKMIWNSFQRHYTVDQIKDTFFIYFLWNAYKLRVLSISKVC